MAYEFTNSWFEYQKVYIVKFITPTAEPYRILEIGAFEGRSTVFWLDNYLDNEQSRIDSIDPFDQHDQTTTLTESTYNLFLHNILHSKYPNKHQLYKGYSNQILPLLTIQKKEYDLITIDGSHLTTDVLYDVVTAFNLLKQGGLMFFDDYGVSDPKKALDAFIQCFEGKIEVLHREYHLLVRKL